MDGIAQQGPDGYTPGRSGLRLPWLTPGLVRDLNALVPGGVYCDVPLAQVSRWQVGGVAPVVVAPGSAAELQKLMAYVSGQGLRYVVLGSSTNLLFADEGLEVLAIHIGARLAEIRVEGTGVWSEAGVWVPAFARRLARAGLSGAEHTCGIPGSLGGLICMNGGSQRKGIGDHIVDVTSVTAQGEQRTRSRDECGFHYRRSVFQGLGEIIVSARFRFTSAESSASVRSEMLTILGQRRRKFPRKMPNCGSVFVSNPAMYAQYGPPGAVIEACGLKGMRVGGAMISPLHANFIVNNDHARAADILTLIGVARRTVRERTGYNMAAEVCYVSPAGEIVPAHVRAEALWVPAEGLMDVTVDVPAKAPTERPIENPAESPGGNDERPGANATSGTRNGSVR